MAKLTNKFAKAGTVDLALKLGKTVKAPAHERPYRDTYRTPPRVISPKRK